MNLRPAKEQREGDDALPVWVSAIPLPRRWHLGLSQVFCGFLWAFFGACVFFQMMTFPTCMS